ncbi:MULTISPECIES: GtrA family protein [Paracoccus]|uniref:GtrA family protein n=1 Tax=Paracoccus onubensis TaxID=1675788 RepID=A0A418T1M7_9RHOB|nr:MULTISPECIES: GtrA family protein [Paracoccus]RJE87102.1 GtrA family protein [Paracoccus onubensis]RNI14224.1 GtrA family protein [Paracoccus pantotrophus]WBU55184.1 GtrA family protein [Paracoccus sp. SCSIO 75233]WBU62535.1 GtrA family protein [Paracoccus aerodenitrificans]
MLGAVARFALTGGLATLVHLGVAIGLVWFGMLPLISNTVAFLIAFMVSFSGHHLFTFAGHGSSATQTFGRFAMVAAIGFLANEIVLFLLQGIGLFRLEAAVLISTAFAAACTFILSRTWAFAGSGHAR